jgi:glycosyltransferase 2 family protein
MTAPPVAGHSETAGRRFGIAVLRIGVAASVLVYLFRRVRLEQVLDILRSGRSSWLAAAFVATLLLQWLAAARLRVLARRQDLPLSTFVTFEINLASRFYGLFLPGGNIAGIAVRVLRLGKTAGNYTGAGMAIAADRLAATSTLCLLGLIFWLIGRPDHGYTWIGMLGLTLVGLSVPTMLVFGRGPAPFLERLARSRLGNWYAALARSRGLSADDLAWIFFISIAAHLIDVGVFWMLARALDLDMTIVSMGWVRSCILLSTLLPVTVAGLGLREGASILLLGLYGVSEERALAFGLLVFAITSLGLGLAGGLLEGWRGLAQIGLGRRDHV